MRLSRAHRSSFLRFLALYFLATLLTVGGFSYLHYTIKKEQLLDETYHKLREEAFTLSSAIVDAQMHHRAFEFPKEKGVAFFDKKGHLIAGTPMQLVNREFVVKNGEAFYLDRSARGHLGVEYILLKDDSFKKHIEQIKKETFWLFVAALLFLLAVGIYLGKLFLEPIRLSLQGLDRFVKDSAHELNTPVTTLLLAAQKIERHGAKPSYLRSLKVAAMKIAKIYKDLAFLAFEKEERKEVVRVDEVINRSLELYEILTEQKGLDLVVALESCQVVADPQAIELMLGNIIDNAIKYAPPRTPLRIKLQKCRLVVQNSGSIRNTKEIFERYRRAESVQGGFGIGLDIVKEVARKYGFRIGVESKEGVVRFIVEFKEA